MKRKSDGVNSAKGLLFNMIFHLRKNKHLDPSSKCFIYGLLCPYVGDLKYIGISNNPKNRLGQHVSDSFHETSKKAKWINILFFEGCKPLLHIFHECENRSVGLTIEKRLINYLQPPLNTKI